MQADLVYKLLTEAEWRAIGPEGKVASALDLADGFVHLSAASQLRETAARHFAGKGKLRLLAFRPDQLEDLRWEPSRNGDLFPHVYGTLLAGAAVLSIWLEPGPDGVPAIPEDVA